MHIAIWRLKAGIAEPEWTFIPKQWLRKQVSAEINTHTTIEELPFLCNGEVNITIEELLGNGVLFWGRPLGYITRISGLLR
jgi:hypothetical protein